MAREILPATVSSIRDVASTAKETDSQSQRGFDRRSLLKGLGVVGVAVSAGSLLAPEEAHASGGLTHGDAAILRIADLDGGSVLARAAEEELTEAITFVGIVAGGASNDKSTGAVAKQTSKFAGDPAGSECSAVDVGGDDGDGLSLSRSDQGLCEHQRVEQTEAGAADIQCAAVFTDE